MVLMRHDDRNSRPVTNKFGFVVCTETEFWVTWRKENQNQISHLQLEIIMRVLYVGFDAEEVTTTTKKDNIRDYFNTPIHLNFMFLLCCITMNYIRSNCTLYKVIRLPKGGVRPSVTTYKVSLSINLKPVFSDTWVCVAAPVGGLKCLKYQ